MRAGTRPAPGTLPAARQIREPQVLVPGLLVAAFVEQARGDMPSALSLLQECQGVLATGSSWGRLAPSVRRVGNVTRDIRWPGPGTCWRGCAPAR